MEAHALVLLAAHHRQGAKNRPPESIAARWGAVALKVNLLHHANSGIEWKTLANHKANAKAALFWFRRASRDCYGGADPLMPEWQPLRRDLKDLSLRGKLSGLIRYCSLKGIAPGAVDQAVVDADDGPGGRHQGAAGDRQSLERQPRDRRLAATRRTDRTSA